MNYTKRFLAVIEVFTISETYWHALIWVLGFADVTFNKIFFDKLNWITNINDKKHLNSMFKWLILEIMQSKLLKSLGSFSKMYMLNSFLLNEIQIWCDFLIPLVYFPDFAYMFSTSTFKSDYNFLKIWASLLIVVFFKALSWCISLKTTSLTQHITFWNCLHVFIFLNKEASG